MTFVLQVGEDLVTVLDQLRIKHVIGLGDGAGANILARFAMMHGESSVTRTDFAEETVDL